MPDGPVVAAIVFVVAAVLLVAYFAIDHRKHARENDRARTREVERLPLFGTDLLSTRSEDGSLRPAAEGDVPVVRAERRVPTVPRPTPPIAGNGVVGPSANGAASGAANGYAPSFAPPHAPPRPASGTQPAPMAAGPIGADAALLNGETLRFALPDEGTLRFLPGRLEVSSGPDAGREVRFIAPPGPDGRGPNGEIEVTFGRTEGPAFRHIQLLARTVSRRHALMRLSDDHWSLINLSATNPVVLNGRPLAADEVAPLLVDGDRIEMGEVVFTFHSR